MPDKTLIVLFGHTNTAEGQLSTIAQARAGQALALLRKNPACRILPTGAFGDHFNRSPRPHSRLLTDYLLANGATPEQVLPGTNSANTWEDCLCARLIALDQGFSRILAVTSDFHLERVRFIAERVLQPLGLDYHAAATPAELLATVTREERGSIRRLQREWIAPALYEPGKPFPQVPYEAAAADQRHYDTISLATVSAIVVVAAFSLSVFQGEHLEPLKAPVLLAASLVSLLLLNIYERTAQTARAARRVMRSLEVGWNMRGFSAAYDQGRLFSNVPAWRRPPPISIRSAVYAVTLMLALFLATSAVVQLLAR